MSSFTSSFPLVRQRLCESSQEGVEEHSIQEIVRLLSDKERARKIWLQASHVFHLSEKSTNSPYLIDNVEAAVNDLIGLYTLAVC